MQRLKWLALGAGILVASAAVAAGPETADPGLALATHRLPPLPSRRIDAELAYLRTALRITDTQTQRWNVLADVLRAIAKHRDAKALAMRAEIEGQAQHPLNPIAMLEQRQRGLTEESNDVGALIMAAKPLYASLDADQRKAADSLLPPAGGPPPMEPPMGPAPMWRPFPD